MIPITLAKNYLQDAWWGVGIAWRGHKEEYAKGGAALVDICDGYL